MAERVALLLDGGFVKKRLEAKNRRFPTAADVVALSQSILEKGLLRNKQLFRVYYYDAPPLGGIATNPLDGTSINPILFTA